MAGFFLAPGVSQSLTTAKSRTLCHTASYATFAASAVTDITSISEVDVMKKLFTLAAASLLASTVLLSGSAEAGVTKAMMRGAWTAVLGGNTGCGISSMYVTFRLNSSGVGVATIEMHSTGCANSITTENPISIQTLNADGRGTAGLSCGLGCGWQFKIQVAEGGHSFILADVDADNPNNTPTGMAIHVAP